MATKGRASLVDILQSTRLKGHVTVEAIESRRAQKCESSGEKPDVSDPCIGHEQCFHLCIPLPQRGEMTPLSQGKTKLIIAADNSGSMAGSPWKQVQRAIINMKQEADQRNSNMEMELIVYNTKAKLINSEGNFIETVQNLGCKGMTNFIKAFNMIESLITTNTSGLQHRVTEKTVIVFMTDGQDTANVNNQLITAVDAFKQTLNNMDHPVIVHVVGFSRDHDLVFLQRLQHCGSEEGMYRYCEPSDGPEALMEKLQQLFEYIYSTRSEVDVNVTLTTPGQLLSKEKGQSAAYRGEIINRNDTEPADFVIEIEGWIYQNDPYTLPQFQVQVQVLDVKLDVDVTDVCRRLVTSDHERGFWSIRILGFHADQMTTLLSTALKNNTEDLTSLEDKLLKLQRRISKVQVYGGGSTREYRQEMLQHVKNIQAKVDKMHTMLAQYKRGEGGSVGFMARVSDLRYEAQFSKNRRQRLMDMRVSRNAAFVNQTQARLDSLITDEKQLNMLSQQALDFYFCVLSQNNVRDILIGEDKDDLIGFGIAVQRLEFVVDDPTSLKLCSVSGTLVSRSSIMDAIQYRINVDGHLSAHGGFDFDNQLGVATVGQSREPINAWLPLYVCESHWQRVKLLLRPTLGYLCTLDPLGYENKQLDVLFMILGCMIGQLNPRTSGQHQLRMLFAFNRLCAEVMSEFDLASQAVSVLENFMAGPAGRTKDVVPSLPVLLGYLVCLPHSQVQDILNCTDKFWLSFLAESLRRAAGSIFKDSSDGAINGILNQLLHGTQDTVKEELLSDPYFALCTTLSRAEGEGAESSSLDDVSIFDPFAGITRPDMKLKHSAKVDQAMELWALNHCGLVKNKNQKEKVRAASRVVEQWIRDGKEMVRGTDIGETESETDESHQYNCQAVTNSMLDTLVKVLMRISPRMIPALSSYPACIAFLRWWMTEKPDWDEMDKNSGLPPDMWVESVKQALTLMHHTIQDSSSENIEETVHVVEDTEVITETTDGCEMSESQGGAMAANKSDLNDLQDDIDNDLLIDSDPYHDFSDDDFIDDDFDVQRTEPCLRQERSFKVTLAQLLNICLPQEDVVGVARAMLCQAVYFYSNARARAHAASTGSGLQLLDLGEGIKNADNMVTLFHEYLKQSKDGALEKIRTEALNLRANHCMIHATSPWAFVGYLMNTYKERDEGFSNLVSAILTPRGTPKKPHCLEDKVRIMLTGKYQDCAVIASGNIWYPEKKNIKLLKDALGEEVWTEIDLDLRSNVQIHVYRESDIPNRHGHCNSNPYIPNNLRQKLGMPLIKEK